MGHLIKCLLIFAPIFANPCENEFEKLKIEVRNRLSVEGGMKAKTKKETLLELAKRFPNYTVNKIMEDQLVKRAYLNLMMDQIDPIENKDKLYLNKLLVSAVIRKVNEMGPLEKD